MAKTGIDDAMIERLVRTGRYHGQPLQAHVRFPVRSAATPRVSNHEAFETHAIALARMSGQTASRSFEKSGMHRRPLRQCL
jgi:hypothetical protein